MFRLVVDSRFSKEAVTINEDKTIGVAILKQIIYVKSADRLYITDNRNMEVLKLLKKNNKGIFYTFEGKRCYLTEQEIVELEKFIEKYKPQVINITRDDLLYNRRDIRLKEY